jgi:hypothetical protein
MTYAVDKNGKCVGQLVVLPPTLPPACPPGTFRQRNGRCEGPTEPPVKCPSGYEKVKNKCKQIEVPCKFPTVRNKKGQCVVKKCAAGFEHNEKYICVSKPIDLLPCAPGTVRSGKNCVVAPCPPGTTRNAKNRCVGLLPPSCPVTYKRNKKGLCVSGQLTVPMPCPPEFVRNKQGKCIGPEPVQCPPRTKRNKNGICKAPECEAGFYRNAEGKCVPAPCKPGSSRNAQGVCRVPKCPEDHQVDHKGRCVRSNVVCEPGSYLSKKGVCKKIQLDLPCKVGKTVCKNLPAGCVPPVGWEQCQKEIVCMGNTPCPKGYVKNVKTGKCTKPYVEFKCECARGFVKNQKTGKCEFKFE